MDTPSKAYILFLTCTFSRAIHFELVHDMWAPARCTMPDIVISDNFKTFKCIEIKSFMTHNNITQKFVFSAAPCVGGFYERLVKSVKLPLRKILGRSLLFCEDMETVCEV